MRSCDGNGDDSEVVGARGRMWCKWCAWWGVMAASSVDNNGILLPCAFQVS